MTIGHYMMYWTYSRRVTATWLLSLIKSNEDAKAPANSSISNPSMLTINTNTSSCPMPVDHRGKCHICISCSFFLKKISAIVKFMEKQNYLLSEGCESAFYMSMSNWRGRVFKYLHWFIFSFFNWHRLL